MMSISFLLPIAIVFATAIGLAVLVTAVKASRIRLKSMRAEPVDLARVPQATRAVLDIGRDWLRARGFRYLSSWKIRPMIAKATEWKYSDVYAADDGATFAVVSPREQPRPGDIVAIEFESVFADGVVMTTFNRGKWRFGAASAVAFVAVGAFLWDPAFALILLGVIAFHEGGHYLAMKAVGYRNLHVFFVPGLGGLATGEKQDASAAQKVLVYLAGPVPGIAVATAGLIALPADVSLQYPWVNQLLNVTLTINLINLLPVTPLDGGRVLEVLLFMRWPRLRVAFTAVSALVLIGAGALLGERAMLIIGVLVAAALPAQWRFSRLARAIGRAPGERMEEQPAARRVFTALASTRFAKWTYQHRAVAADELIGQLRTPVPGVIGVGVGLALYAACLVAPLGAAVVAWPGTRDLVMDEDARDTIAAMMAEEQQAAGADAVAARDWSTELGHAKQAPPEQRLSLLAEAAEAGFIPGEGAEQDFKANRAEMRRIADQLPPGNVARANGLLAILESGAAETDAAALRALMAELDGATPESAAARGRVGVALARHMDSSAERLQLLKQSRDAMLASGKPVGFSLDDAWSELAQELAKRGDPAGAETEWRALLGRYASAPQDRSARVYADSARMGYSTFLLRQARFDDDEAFLRPLAEEAIAQGKRTALMRSSWQMEDLFWMAVRKGDAAQASKWLDAWGAAPGAKRNPQYALAQLAAAELVHDEKKLAQARSRIAALPGTSPVLCQSTLPKYEDTEIGAKRAALMTRYEVCKGRSA